MADQNNNYNASDNTSPGFATGNNTVPGQQGGMAVAAPGGGVNILQQLLQALSTPTQGGQSQGGMAVGSGGAAQPTGPYQKGVAKALQEYGYTHGTQALQAGMPAQSIQNHELMTGGGQSSDQGQINPNVQAILQHLVQQGGGQQGAGTPTAVPAMPGNGPQASAQPSVIPPQNAFTAPSYNSQNGNIQEGGWVNRGARGLVTGGLPGLLGGLLGPSATQQQSAVAGSQDIKAKVAQTAQNSALADYQQLQNQGQKPIDPEQYLSAYSNMYQKAYDAYSKDEESGNQITQSSLDAYNKLSDTTRNAIQKGLGQSTPAMQKTLQAAAASLKASIDARTNFHNFMFQNSPSQVIGQIKNKITGSPSSNSTSPGGLKVGDKFNGEKIVNVKQIG